MRRPYSPAPATAEYPRGCRDAVGDRRMAGAYCPRDAPRTGFAYLDEVPRDPGGAGLRPPRRRLPPRDRGPREHHGGVPARRRARLRLPRDRRPRHPRRRAAGLPRRGARPGHRPPRARSRELTLDEVRPGADRRPRAGADAGRALRRVPGRPLQHRPQVRRRGRGRWPTFIEEREAWDRVLVGSFSAPPAAARSAGSPSGRVPTSAPPARGRAFRLLPSGRLADRLTRGRVAALQVPHRRGRLVGRHPRAGTTRARRPASTCTCGPSTTPTR